MEIPWVIPMKITQYWAVLKPTIFFMRLLTLLGPHWELFQNPVTACCLTADMSHILVNSGSQIIFNVSVKNSKPKLRVWSAEDCFEKTNGDCLIFVRVIPVPLGWTFVGLILVLSFQSSYNFEKLMSSKMRNTAPFL